MYTNDALYKTIKELQVIEQAQLDDALAVANNQQVLLGDILLEKNLLTEEDLGKQVAELLSVPFVKLSENVIPKEILLIIP